ncbi:DsrE/DsrF/TusD sulfur relay family protein [Aliarcobacter butzleri]|uniref:DsrE/DsrF/TusD sulfur relay family protein n=1 Tax=Aliarcobacter butzleri TaxID=28197 RepID=UPI00344E1E36
MTLFILNNQPYDGSDKTYNALRLAKNLKDKKEEIKIFLMCDAVDLARDATKKPDFYEYDLVQMLKELYENGVELKVCGTCMARCGLNKNEPYFNDEIKSTMDILGNWTILASKVLIF